MSWCGVDDTAGYKTVGAWSHSLIAIYRYKNLPCTFRISARIKTNKVLSGICEPSLRFLGSTLTVSDTSYPDHQEADFRKKWSGALAKAKINRQSPQSRDKKYRSWAGSALFAAVVVIVVLAVAVLANLAVGRIIHWFIVSSLGSVGFVFLVIGRRYNTI